MATITELFDGASVTQQTRTTPISYDVPYKIEGLADNTLATITAQVESLLPATFNGSPLKSWKFIERINNEAVKIRAVFQSTAGTPSSSDLLTEQFTFDTGGGTKHITVSEGTVWSSAGAPDLGGIIGYDKERVQGTDIGKAKFDFQITKEYLTPDSITIDPSHYFANNTERDDYFVANPTELVTGMLIKNGSGYQQYTGSVWNDVQYIFDENFRTIIELLSWTVNSAAWNGYAAERVLFRGASGRKSNGIYSITYNFSAGRVLTDVDFGGVTIPTLSPWDYAWAQYEDQKDATAKEIIKKVKHVYVEQVYFLMDFSLLGLTF